jgi:hypothetical protein
MYLPSTFYENPSLRSVGIDKLIPCQSGRIVEFASANSTTPQTVGERWPLFLQVLLLRPLPRVVSVGVLNVELEILAAHNLE